MTGALALSLITLAIVLAIIMVVFARRGGHDRVLTPIGMFLVIDVAATIPAMLPTSRSVLFSRDGNVAILVMVGLLMAVGAYALVGGPRADNLRWRNDDAVDRQTVRDVGIGLGILVAILTGITAYRFKGVPPMLSGGFRSLLDPVGNAEQVALIREGRRSLTKGSVLLGDSYQGQGLMNVFSEVGWMLAVAVAVLYWSWRRTRGSVATVGLVILLMFVFQGSTGQRAPLIFAVLCGVAAMSMRIRLRGEAILGAAVVMIGFVLLIMPLAKGEKAGVDLLSRVEAAWTRVTDGNGRNSAHIVNLIDSGQLKPFHGSLFAERATAVLPGVASQDPFAYRLSGLVNGTGTNKTGYATPTQFGLLYAEGGPTTVLLGYAATGALIGGLWRMIMRIRGPAGAAAASVSVVVLGKIAITGAPGMAASAAVLALAVGIVMAPSALRSLLGRDQSEPPNSAARTVVS